MSVNCSYEAVSLESELPQITIGRERITRKGRKHRKLRKKFCRWGTKIFLE